MNNFREKRRRIFALIIKEFYQIVRDPSSILIALVFPILLLFIYGVGISLDITNLKVGLVLQDTSPEMQSFALSLKNSKYFSIDSSLDQKELELKLTKGDLRGLVIVPFYFSNYQNRPDNKGRIYVIADGSEPNTANFVKNYIRGAYFKWLTQEKINQGINPFEITVEPRFWYNEALNSRFFLIPGSIAIIMTLIGCLLTALVIAREWERGTIEALMATPCSIREIYFSKMISYFVLGLISMILCTTISILFYKVPFQGSFLALLFVSAIFLLTALGTGLLISSVAKNQFLASQISIIIAFLPAFMLSGFVFEISSMPFIIRMITYIIPAKYMVACLKTLFLAGNVWRLLLVNISIMTVVAIILLSVIFFKIKKRLD